MMHSASHNYQLVTNDRIVVWKFFNINLPDSNTNEPLSHGFIEYSIMPIQGLPDGTTIQNSANIYFDFNAPVITNTTLNTLQTNIVSLSEISNGTHPAVYPNPSTGIIHLFPNGTDPHLKISLFDIAGKHLQDFYDSGYTTQTPILADLSQYDSGIYIIRFEGESVNGTVKVVKTH